MTTRIEKDTMGEMEVPNEALYGASTQRAVINFPISDLRFSRDFIYALGVIKKACAKANLAEGNLDQKVADAITKAADEVIAGTLDKHFVVDIYQTGSGTSSNMNSNEVIANRAIQILGGEIGDKSIVHPNDHVNMSQSSNDVIPTAIHISACKGIQDGLLPALKTLSSCLKSKSEEFNDVIKSVRPDLITSLNSSLLDFKQLDSVLRAGSNPS